MIGGAAPPCHRALVILTAARRDGGANTAAEVNLCAAPRCCCLVANPTAQHEALDSVFGFCKYNSARMPPTEQRNETWRVSVLHSRILQNHQLRMVCGLCTEHVDGIRSDHTVIAPCKNPPISPSSRPDSQASRILGSDPGTRRVVGGPRSAIPTEWLSSDGTPRSPARPWWALAGPGDCWSERPTPPRAQNHHPATLSIGPCLGQGQTPTAGQRQPSSSCCANEDYCANQHPYAIFYTSCASRASSSRG